MPATRLARTGVALLLAGLSAFAAPGAAWAAPCSPQELMLKVGTLTDLLERQMQRPAAARRAAMARMHDAMQRRRASAAGVTDYAGVCDAYDDLIDQLRR